MTKQRIALSTIIVVIVAGLAITACNKKKESPNPAGSGTFSMIDSQTPIDLEAFEHETGWGYKISINNEPFIYQEFIPGIEGNKPFQSKEEAQKCGELVVKKMKLGQNFSTKRAEIDSLGIRY